MRFEELDSCETRMGPLSLRRRLEPTLQVDVYEVKLGDEHLMSSLFTVAERALATLGLSSLPEDRPLDVLVGGLGLGYTAQQALQDRRVRSMQVVEALEPVIDWHRRQLLPDTAGLAVDTRCRLVHDDFFALVAESRADASLSPSRLDAVLLDVDHTPRHVLHPSHAPFYEPEGLARLGRLLRPDGVFALWSDDPPDPVFLRSVRSVFASCEAQVVPFRNPLTGGESANSIYIARGPTGVALP